MSIFFIVISFCLFFFQDFITSFIPMMKYYDEFFSALSVFFLIYYLYRNNFVLRLERITILMIIFIIVYIISGIISFILNSHQPINALFSDLYLNLKFFLAIFIGGCIKKKDIFTSPYFIRLIEFMTLLLFTLLILNCFIPIFENQEIRFGIAIPKLFYSHSGYLAAIATLLLTMTFCVYHDMAKSNIFIMIQIFIIFATLRYKAMATAILCTTIFIVVIIKKKKLKWAYFILPAIIIVFLAWDQIQLYYSPLSIESARGALTSTAIQIGKDMFPLGSGFGSYASYMSRVYYSDIYFEYGLQNVWGLSQSFSSFISDTFWPMIVGQTGIIGLFSYVMIIYFIYKHIKKMKSRFSYISGISVLIYLLMESTSAAAFVSPSAVPFGLWLGVLISGNVCTKTDK